MAEIVVYEKGWCPYCSRAKALLDAKGVPYRSVDVLADPALEREMVDRSGRYTVPQIFIGDRHIGGYDDLAALDGAGKLDPLLNA